MREPGAPQVGVDQQHAAARADERAAEPDHGRGLALALARRGDRDDLSAADAAARDDACAHAHDVEGVGEDAVVGVVRIAHEWDGREHGLVRASLHLLEIVDRAVELVADPGQQDARQQADEDAEYDVEREPRRDRRGAARRGRGELHRGRLAPAVGERMRDLLGELRAAAAQRRDLVVELGGGRSSLRPCRATSLRMRALSVSDCACRRAGLLLRVGEVLRLDRRDGVRGVACARRRAAFGESPVTLMRISGASVTRRPRRAS